MPLSLTSSGGTSAPVLTLSGEIDISTVTVLRRGLHHALEAGATTIAVDMSSVRFIDSSGVGVLVAAYRRAQQANVSLRLVRPAPLVSKVLALTRVDQLIPITAEDPDSSALAG